MKNSIYSTAAGMLTSLARLDISTNNLVNIGTTGYKSDISFEETLRNLSGGPFPGKDQPILGGNAIDMKNGIIQTTGRDLDLAFEGPGFFAVQGPNGQELYTRNGEFDLNSNKDLVNADGYCILDKFDKKITVIGDKFQFSPSGELFIDGAYYTTLKIVDIPNRDHLEKIGGTFFKLKDNAPQPQPQFVETPQMAVGALEKSNADLLLEAANISNTQRTFDAQKAVADVVLNSLRKVITEIPRPI